MAAVMCLALTLTMPPAGSSVQRSGAPPQDPVIARFGKALMDWKTLREPRFRLPFTDAFLDLTQGANRPSPESVRSFLDQLLAAVGESRLNEDQAMRLAFDVHEVLHCAWLNEEGFESVLKDARRQLRAAGIPRPETDGIVSRLRAMGDEVRDLGRIMDAPLH